jgi:hypothetical protein
MSNVVPKIAESSEQSGREARLTRDRGGDPLGAAVWLNATELAALGVDTDAADLISYRVSNGELCIDADGD